MASVFDNRRPGRTSFISTPRRIRKERTTLGRGSVVADSVFEAMALVAEGFRVNDVDTQVAAVAAAVRVIGCFAVRAIVAMA